MDRGFTRSPPKVFAIPRLCVLLITAARPCLSDIPFDARNWKSFGGRFHSTNARKFAYSRPLHLLKSDPLTTTADVSVCERRYPLRIFRAVKVTAAAIRDEFDRLEKNRPGKESQIRLVRRGAAGPAATDISGPRDKELNFSLVYFILEFAAEDVDLSAWSWSREMSHDSPGPSPLWRIDICGLVRKFNSHAFTCFICIHLLQIR